MLFFKQWLNKALYARQERFAGRQAAEGHIDIDSLTKGRREVQGMLIDKDFANFHRMIDGLHRGRRQVSIAAQSEEFFGPCFEFIRRRTGIDGKSESLSKILR